MVLERWTLLTVNVRAPEGDTRAAITNESSIPARFIWEGNTRVLGAIVPFIPEICYALTPQEYENTILQIVLGYV